MSTSEYITLSGNMKDLTGLRSGRLVALGPVDHIKKHGVVWIFQCDCGKTHKMLASKFGYIKSCGCGHVPPPSNIIHGMAGTRVYSIWENIIQRCNNPKNQSYKSYGGRGITICTSWLTFQNFYNDMGDPTTGKHEIDRINNNANYEPSNCHWVTRKENNRNKRDNILLTHGGYTATVKEWSERIGMAYETLLHRVGRLGWSTEKAITTPARKYKRQNR